MGACWWLLQSCTSSQLHSFAGAKFCLLVSPTFCPNDQNCLHRCLSYLTGLAAIIGLQGIPQGYKGTDNRECCAAAGFADKRLQRGGRCHESEIFSAFRRDFARYRSAEALPDTVLRDMVRNWYPDVERTRTGYYKNVSLRAYVDAFTGQQAGFTASTPGLNGNSTTTGSSALDNTSSVSSSLEASSAMYSSRTGKGGSGLVNSTLEE